MTLLALAAIRRQGISSEAKSNAFGMPQKIPSLFFIQFRNLEPTHFTP
jgi:hypothetical protein